MAGPLPALQKAIVVEKADTRENLESIIAEVVDVRMWV
jgi:hypothetical protein